MNTIRHYITLVEAALLSERVTRIDANGTTVRVHENPSAAVVSNILKQSPVEYRELRWFTDHDGRLYVWEAQHVIHDHAAEALGTVPWIKGYAVRPYGGVHMITSPRQEWVSTQGLTVISSDPKDEVLTVPTIGRAFPLAPEGSYETSSLF